MPDDLDAFKVKTPSDVWACLKKLDEARAALDLEFIRLPGRHVTVRLENLDEQLGCFHLNPELPEPLRLPAPTPIRLSCTQKQLKIQFDTVVTQSEPTAGKHVRMVATIPRHLYRIQRRNTFRIANCQFEPIVIRLSVDGKTWLRHPLYDVSIGGCSFLFDPLQLALEPGSRIAHGRLSVPGEGDIDIPLDVRTISKPKADKQQPAGNLTLKAGCQFVELPFKQEAMIQRFIIAAEHKQKSAV
jgi:c-di-GMP-binding flagellar brake protein YcgR